ncbi:hypothetical protein G647_00142 [Cladophialophora carrionii CBS 160.54]|uniref:Glycosyltransferase family 25 protein n=1 Tax=Cladophialophora carrionii CBS 160.54 TaxID=1279043 RepID=V9DMZ9_9EURO|nr:uncharacterized protein G647_00142 [Cladophialophora carrionii CBS 160.54]ETI27693.1 hypothetical protein G647_00142 [Cladophialophora carrionii CBS 160.54]
MPQFQKLLVLSTGDSWRIRGLKAAASLMGLDLTIPIQPPNPQELITAFEHIGKDSGKPTPAHGSATAWLAHVDLLKFVIASGFETAFIVEDDVDFDVRLKAQIRLISDNVREFVETPDHDPRPYGDNWDVLWLGHCGSAIEDWMPPGRKYRDETRCETEHYSGWSKHFLRDKLEENYRLVQTSVQTVCTFGYGVTRQSAPKVLKLLAAGANEAFDVSMSSFCSSGDLRCVVVNPQIMNHYEPPRDAGYLSPVHVGDGQGETVNDTAFEAKMGTTGNIEQSARCKALFDSTCMRPPSEI